MRPVPIVLALAFSYALTQVLVAMSYPGHGPNHYYGAPIPVGTSEFDLIAGPLGPDTFSQPIFIVDVLLTAAVLVLVGRRLRSVGVIVAGVGAFAVLVLVFFMYVKGLDFVGLPIPVSLRSRPPLPEAVLVWIDMMIWAFAAALLAGRIARWSASDGPRATPIDQAAG